MKSLQKNLQQNLSRLVFVLLVIQPVMDVFSYFMTELGSSMVSTLLRFCMLGAVALLGFLTTERKRAYLVLYGIMALYWVLHVANCFRIGYSSVYQDTANYLRILTFPVFLLSFLTFFRHDGEQLRKTLGLGCAVNIGLSVLFTALPWGLAAIGIGERVYTYDKLFVGVMGWFAIPNAQSCIITLLTPLALYFAWRTKKLWLYGLVALGCFGLMYVTGTKLTYYCIYLIPVCIMMVHLLNPERKKALPYCAVLVLTVVLGVVLKAYSPMQVRENMTDYSQGYLSERVEQSLEESGASEEAMEAIKNGTVEDVEETDDEEDEQISDEEAARLLREVRRGLLGVYTDPDVYGKTLEDLNDRFGVYNVMAVYHYSAHSGALSDLRLRKTNYAELVWKECDLPTKILGFEYSKMLHNGNVYDLENDFPAVYYNCGWLGFALYLIPLLYTAFVLLRAFFKDPFHFLTPEVGAAGITFVLALGSAQVSGYVLRRPNVAIYLAMTTAYLIYLAEHYRAATPEQVRWYSPGFWKEKLKRNKEKA